MALSRHFKKPLIIILHNIAHTVSTDVSFYIYDRPLTGSCGNWLLCLQCVDKLFFYIFAVMKQCLLQRRNTESSFVCIGLIFITVE